MSPAPDSTLDDPQKIIADLQRQLANAVAERDEALEQQTATTEVLQIINASPGELASVFQAMVEKALRLCEATRGTLRTYDGEAFHLVASVASAQGEALALPFAGQGPNSLFRRFIDGEPIVHLADVLNSPEYQSNASVQQGMDAARARSWLGVSLRKNERLLGVISVVRQEVRPFSDQQISLLQNFAAQAVIAMENARLITETREALEQQTATAEVLGVINSSPGDLAPVFDAILEKALNLCEAACGHLYRYDGEFVHPMAMRGEARYIEFLRQRGAVRLPEGSPTPIMRVISSGEYVQVPDCREDEGYRLSERFRAQADAGGWRSALCVPLRKDTAVVGTITVFRQEVQPFTDKQIALLQNFAAQAVIAIENARLLGELRQRTDDLTESLEYQTATSDVLKVISRSTFDLQPVLDTLLQAASRLCGNAEGGLAIRQADAFRYVATVALEPEFDAGLRERSLVPGRGSTVGRVALEGHAVHIADVAADPEYALPEVYTLGKIRTNLGVPLLRQGETIGVITLAHRRVEPFTERQIALVSTFADEAVIAMENARLITETREALEQQTATAEVLGVINSSPGDLPPVFDAMVERAVRLCEADAAVARTFDGELLHLAAAHAPSWMMEQLQELGPSHLNWLYEPLSRGEHVIHIPDVRETKAYCEIPGARERLDRRGIRSWLAVALRKDGALLGVLNVHRPDVRPFTDKQIALLQNFAAQAVIAMENARLLGELRQRTDEVGELNRGLEARVAEQVDELGRVGRLKRFLAPQLAELIVSQGDERILESHRREIVVVFCDLRGYTAFTETAEPEEVLEFLRQYHGALGPLVSQFEGTLDQFSGDGIMVFFNDPVPCPDPAVRAVKMAVAMRSAASTLISRWRERGRDLGFGAGIAQGYATLGQIGFSERSGYTAIGTVCNVAARLCAEAKDGQILLGQRVNVELNGSVATEQLGPVTLKGLTQPVVAYNVPLGAIQPALRIIEGGSPETV